MTVSSLETELLDVKGEDKSQSFENLNKNQSNEIDELNDVIAGMQEEIKNLEETNRTLQAKMATNEEEYNVNIAESRKAIDEVLMKYNASMSSIELLQEDLENARMTVSSLETELLDTKSKEATAFTELSFKNVRVDELQCKLNDMSTELSKVEAKLQEEKKKTQRLVSNNEKLNDDLKKQVVSQQEAAAPSQDFKQLERELKEAYDALLVANTNQSRSLQELDTLKIEFNTQMKLLNKSEEQNSNLREKLQEGRSSNESLSKELMSLKSKLEDAEKSYRTTIQSSMEQSDALSTCNIKVTSLETKLEAEFRHHEDTKGRLSALETELQQREKLLRTEAKELDELHEVIAGLEKELKDERESNGKSHGTFSTQIDALNKELQAKAQSIGEKTAVVSALKSQLDDKIREANEFKDLASKMREELLLSKTHATSCEEKLKALQESTSDLNLKNTDLMNQLHEIGDLKTRIDTENEIMKKQLQEALMNLKESNDQRENTQANLVRLQADLLLAKQNITNGEEASKINQVILTVMHIL